MTETLMPTGVMSRKDQAEVLPPGVRPFTGRKALFWLLGFFGVVMAVNVVFIKLALQTLPGVVTDSPYKEGNAYNSTIAAARSQETLHWSVGLHVERRVDGTAVVKVEAKDAGGGPLSGLAVKAQLMRPTDRRADATAELAEVGAGAYRGTASDVLAGVWDVVLTAERKGEPLFRSRNRIVLE